ncbi:MAG: carboxylesterase family protein [Synergistaceae bacterium]|nr:carboxylesterase family protein [Synergistaceae bacterium]
MKKLFTLDDIMIAFIAALGYGLGLEIPKNLGCAMWLCSIICLIIGLAVEGLVEKIVFSKAVQKSILKRVMIFAAFVIIFIAAEYLSVRAMGASMVEHLLTKYVFVIGLPVAGFAFSMLMRWYRIRKVRKLYGDGSGGYVFDLAAEEIEDVNRQNKAIAGDYDADLAVKTRTGVYVGERDKNLIFYRGIPYAKPPVGELRWKAPVPLASSNNVFEAQNFGASAIQVEHKGVILKHHRQSEDCLYLNICVGRQDKSSKKPVLVLFHHGDFTCGGSADPLLYCDKFIDKHQDIIFVNFNYRLGIFGFIDFSEVPGGEDYPDALNLGLLDQLAALKWIKENIAAFGGDPDRITVIGFESGAVSIMLLAVSKQAQGLFNKAFVFQGSYIMAYDTPDASRTLAKDLLNETGSSTMQELAALSTDSLKAAAQRLWKHLCAPTCDGKFIPVDAYKACQAGAASGIDFIVGIPRNETQVLRAFVGESNYEEFLHFTVKDMQQYFDAQVAQTVQDYIDTQTAAVGELEAMRKLAEQWIAIWMYRVAVKLAAGGNKVHLMYWDEEPLIENLGSGSVDAITALLGNSKASQMYGNVMNADLSVILQSLLVKFINGKALQLYQNEIKGIDAFNWPAFNDKRQALIAADNKIKCAAIDDKLTDIKGFLDFMINL